MQNWRVQLEKTEARLAGARPVAARHRSPSRRVRLDGVASATISDANGGPVRDAVPGSNRDLIYCRARSTGHSLIPPQGGPGPAVPRAMSTKLLRAGRWHMPATGREPTELHSGCAESAGVAIPISDTGLSGGVCAGGDTCRVHRVRKSGGTGDHAADHACGDRYAPSTIGKRSAAYRSSCGVDLPNSQLRFGCVVEVRSGVASRRAVGWVTHHVERRGVS